MAPNSAGPLDTELAELPQALRWREWMARVEAVLFASSEPVGREVLARVVGRDCALDLLIEDIAAELAGRPYEIARIAGGWQFRTRPQHAASIRAARGESEAVRDLTQNEALVLTIIAYMQPVTRGAISRQLPPINPCKTATSTRTSSCVLAVTSINGLLPGATTAPGTGRVSCPVGGFAPTFPEGNQSLFGFSGSALFPMHSVAPS